MYIPFASFLRIRMRTYFFLKNNINFDTSSEIKKIMLCYIKIKITCSLMNQRLL